MNDVWIVLISVGCRCGAICFRSAGDSSAHQEAATPDAGSSRVSRCIRPGLRNSEAPRS